MVEAHFKEVKLIVNKQNLGFSTANNQALKKATGKYILILNPDTILEPNTLKVMIAFFQNQKDIGMATCRVELASGKLDRDCRRRFPTPVRAFAHFSHLSKVYPKVFGRYYFEDISANEVHEIDACAGAFMFTTKEVIQKVNYFDEDYFFYGEDLDLCYKIKKTGLKIFFTPQTKIIHYKGASSGMKKHSQHLSKIDKSAKAKVLRESTRAMEIFYKKHYQKTYPSIVTYVVIVTIKLISLARILRLYL